jgi:excisionase family DNA binding protein
MNETDKLLTLSQTAEALGVCTRTVRNWISEGRLPAVRLGDHLIRVRASEVAHFARPIPTFRRRSA